MTLDIFFGFCMSVADSVPGVSGGTIAFILGFYEKLLDSVHNIFSKDVMKRKDSVSFLIKLVLGWVIGISISVTILANIFEKNIYFLSSVFLGLTFLAIPIVIKAEYESIKGKFRNIGFLIFGILLVIGISALRNYVGFGKGLDFSSLDFKASMYIFFSGMVAILAMILPGISGSTILLIFGVYLPLITAIKDFVHFDFSVFAGLVAFGLGVLVGGFIGVKSLRKAIKNKKSEIIYFILGLMVGSFYAIIMGPTTLKNPLKPLGISDFSFVGFAMGAFLLILLEHLKTLLETKKLEEKEELVVSKN